MVAEQQQVLARIMDLFAQRFDRRAILRGGMVLRILGCERLTNDIDYLFVPYKSKKDIVGEVLAVLGYTARSSSPTPAQLKSLTEQWR